MKTTGRCPKCGSADLLAVEPGLYNSFPIGYFDEPLRGTFAAEAAPQKKIGRIRGYINNQYPNARTNYDTSMEKLRQSTWHDEK